MQHSVINIENLHVVYREGLKKEKIALQDLSLQVHPQEIYGFLGPNGAGKTTAIKVLLGLINADGGAVSLFGRPAEDLSARRRIGYLPEIAYYYEYLTARELLDMYARIFFLPAGLRKERIERLLRLAGLWEVRNDLIRTYSKGMQQKIGLAQALINDPDLLILDEPTQGLDAIARVQIRSIITSLRNEGKTIFFSSHELSEVELISDRICIIKDGCTIKQGKLKDLLKPRETQEGPVSLEKFFLQMIQESQGDTP